MKFLANPLRNVVPRFKSISLVPVAHAQSYKDRFAHLDKQDQHDVHEGYKRELNKFYDGLVASNELPSWNPEVLETCEASLLSDLHYIHIVHRKPLSSQQRILVRKYMLPYLEKGSEDQIKFVENLLVYYECL